MNRFISTVDQSHSLYKELIKNCPHFFKSKNGANYITDFKRIEEFENATGERIGVIYQKGNYERFVLDLMEENGELRSSGRLITPAGGVVIVAKMGNKFILEDQYRFHNNQSFLAFPRGHREPDCSLEEDATREIEEELLGASLVNIQYLGKTYPETHSCAWYCDIVSGDIEGLEFDKDNKIKSDGYEGINELRLLSTREIDELIAAGKIDCGYTLAAWAIYKAQTGFVA